VSKTYKTVGDALADPTSNLYRFVNVEAPAAMAYNPTTKAEWTTYMIFLRKFPGASTKYWRKTLMSH
jgi:hypothetical protein